MLAVAVDPRRDLKLAAQARLSGAALAGPACNPVDLTVSSFSRVVDIDFDADDAIRTRMVQVDDDDIDW